ncbi:T4-like virus tail tube protein gp19 [uncultured archaeon]|nr:T4-like virus tail tube protein gp19 [uncultured archaeon]
MNLFKDWQIKILVGFVLISMIPAASAALTGDQRSYVASKYGLILDGQFAGWLYSAEGGDPSSDVILEALGPDNIVRKHIGGVKYENITITVGTGMSQAFYAWIQDTFNHQNPRKNGAIILADYNYKEIRRMNFSNALIGEVGMPALDAASKDAAKMTIKIIPEYTRQTSAFKNNQVGAGFTVVQKLWKPSNFRLHIDGVSEDATSRVNKIEAIIVKQKVVETSVGELRDYQTEPGYLEIPNLVVTLADSKSQPFYDWFEDFVINGNNGDNMEKSGTLEYISPNLQKTFFTLRFEHIGIFKLAAEKVESGNENIRRVKAEMYIENMKFEFPNSTTSTGTTPATV